MNKIAIDVVLLPPKEVASKAISISRKLAETSGNRTVVLGKQDYLPHVSLCMGVVKEEDLPKVNEALSDIASQTAALQLAIDGIKAHDIPTGEKLAVLEFADTASLQSLHETIMQRLRPFLTYDDMDSSMFVSSPEAAPVSMKWVRDFDTLYHNPEQFYPHLTSGFGTHSDFSFPISFEANTLAVCQLGNYCTCRKKLATFELA
ncbi:MAG TPA: 2'-5' RNA ligase family protein [Candidatus Saccharimonadales bacterium]|nr:2'-5' RNA ligase family protein [Candidatus Saccharimonadales bacterium]